MAHETKIDLSGKKHVPLSYEKIAEIYGETTQDVKARMNQIYGKMADICRPYAEGIECPFGERDLMHDTCYMGSGEHKCPYFKRYLHDAHPYGWIICTHPPLTKKPRYIQLSLFDF